MSDLEKLVGDLVGAIDRQTAAISSLVESNMALVQIVLEGGAESDSDAPSNFDYLDQRPVDSDSL